MPAIFFWAELVLLAETTGYAANFSWWSDWWSGWSLFFTGAGVIVLVETAISLIVPEYRRGMEGGLIFGLVPLAFGLGGLASWVWVWPLALIAIGVITLRGAIVRQR